MHAFDRICCKTPVDRSGSVKREPKPLGAVPRATLRGRDHHLVCSVVFALLAQLPRPGRDDGRTGPLLGPRHHLALGPALCSYLNQRLRREVRHPNRSWRVDETYVRVAGKWAYLYRAVDSTGDTIDFLLSPKRDLTAAKLFLRLALSGTGGIRPRVINVDGHPAYARAIAELKQSGDLGRRCRCRPSPYLNNVIEQDHRINLAACAFHC